MEPKMDQVCKELDEVKAELEKLKEDYRIKTELSESLRRANIDQVAKIHEAKIQLEKQSKEFYAKSDDAAEIKQLYEDVKSKLRETESSLKQMRSMNDKFRVDNGEKIQKLEEENRKLVVALEEATDGDEDSRRKLHDRIKEIDGLKKLLSDSQRKCLEAEEKARAGKELRQRDDDISKLEEQSMNFQDQLKWKKEQFEHLEDAHKRLHDQFQSSEKEWTSEKSALLEEISALQSRFDAQVRITESVESRLKMCHQALAHEESRRKVLEIQLSESKQCFEDVLAEFEEAKAKIESLTSKRDEEIAELRNSIGMKETMMKEMEYRAAHLELENKELLESLKELREAQINKRKVDPSLTKLRNKYKDLEQTHNTCATTLKEREDEWNSKMEKLIGDMQCYESELKRKTEQMHQLKSQLDDCHSSLEVSSEQTSILLIVFKSELLNAYAKLFSSETGNCSSQDAPVDLRQAREEISSLTQKIEFLSSFEERNADLENELQEHRKLLEDALICQLCLKEQVSQMEVALKSVSNALEISNSELAAKINEASQAMMELQEWKLKAETLRISLEESHGICRQMEASFLKQIETEKGLQEENESLKCVSQKQEQRIGDLCQKIASLEHKLVQTEITNKALKFKVVEAQEKEEHYIQIINEKNVTVENLQKELETKEQEYFRRESARQKAEDVFQSEKEKLCTIIREEEQNFTDMVLHSLSQSIENTVTRVCLEDALQKTKFHTNAEIEKKKNTIDELETNISTLHEKLLLQEDSFSHLKQSHKKLEVLLEGKNTDMEKMERQFRDEQAALKEAVDDLELEKRAAIENIKRVSSERDGLLLYIEGACEQINGFCAQDVKLGEMFGKLLQNCEKGAPEIKGDKLCEVQKEVNNTKEVEAGIDRSPFREINH